MASPQRVAQNKLAAPLWRLRVGCSGEGDARRREIEKRMLEGICPKATALGNCSEAHERRPMIEGQ